ncbi:MAG: hypothetical protein ACR2GY_12770 [Phycisphaerales bacterium]
MTATLLRRITTRCGVELCATPLDDANLHESIGIVKLQFIFSPTTFFFRLIQSYELSSICAIPAEGCGTEKYAVRRCFEGDCGGARAGEGGGG